MLKEDQLINVGDGKFSSGYFNNYIINLYIKDSGAIIKKQYNLLKKSLVKTKFNYFADECFEYDDNLIFLRGNEFDKENNY